MARTYNNFIHSISYFGAKNLPEVSKSLGQAIVNFKEAKNEMTKETKEVEKTVKSDNSK